jgi:hypothetical protein
MFLNKIKSKESGVLLYGITPPKTQTPTEKIAEIAEKTLARLQNINIDALVVYDVQDESARTNVERPFPFLTALDPLEFAVQHLAPLQVPKIIYRPASKFTKDELSTWVDEVVANDFSLVFVGVPSPDFQPVTSLPEAYEIWNKHNERSVIGAVMIPERHAVLKDEDQRILDKMSSGVSYFISQCVFNVDFAKKVIDDLQATCLQRQQAMPTLIFTLTACGSEKTLDFMEWLGINVPKNLKATFRESDDILAKSVEVCLEIAEELSDYCIEKGIAFGFNIESVAIRKVEIEASIDMANTLDQMLRSKGVRS